MNGVRQFLRNFTARAVRERLESQAEDDSERPRLTSNELDLVRYIVEGSFDWKGFLAASR